MLTKLRHIIVKSIKNKKLNVFSLFLLLAFMILVLSKLSKSYTETLAYELDLVNLPEDKVITSDGVHKLNIVTTTYGFHLLGSYFNNNTIQIDLKNDAYVHNDTYVWLANRALPDIEKQLGDNFEIVAIQPDTLNFRFGSLAVKSVPIKLNADIIYASGYDSLNGLILEPDSVKVIGPDSKINHIQFIETFELNLKDIKTDVNAVVKLMLPIDSKSIKLSRDNAAVIAQVKKFTEGTLEIPVDINNLPPEVQLNYFPKTIKVSYEVSLDDYKTIKPSAFKIECDFLETAKSNASYLTPKFTKAPENIKRLKMKQDKIEYIITE